MRRSMITAVVAAGASLAVWSGSASAQGVEVYVGPGPVYDDYGYRGYRGYGYGPRAYGYRSYDGGGYYRRPESYRYGSKGWWRQMDRNNRGGHTD